MNIMLALSCGSVNSGAIFFVLASWFFFYFMSALLVLIITLYVGHSMREWYFYSFLGIIAYLVVGIPLCWLSRYDLPDLIVAFLFLYPFVFWFVFEAHRRIQLDFGEHYCNYREGFGYFSDEELAGGEETNCAADDDKE